MSDRQFLGLAIGVATLVFSLPVLIGIVLTPAGHGWHGLSLLNPGDPSVYYSYMEQARQGQATLYDALTSEPQPWPLWQPWWWILGRISDLTRLSVPITYAVARFLLIPCLGLALWWATRWALPDRGERRTGFLVALFGGGLGGLCAWLIPGSTISSFPDLWVAEVYPSLTQMSSPHFLVVTIGLLITIAGLERSWQRGQWIGTVVAGAAALVVTTLHPFHVVTWLIYVLIRCVSLVGHGWRRLVEYLARWGVVGGMTLPALLWYALQLSSDPLAQARAAQNNNITSHPGYLLLSLGLVVPMAIVTIWKLRRRWPSLGPILSLAGAYAVAVYLPFDWQRRLGHGMFIPFAWLAAPALWAVWRRWSKQWHWTSGMLAAIIAISIIASPLWTATAVVKDYLREIHEGQAYMYYLSREQQDLIATIQKRSDPHRPLLASLTMSRTIAGLTAHKVYAGHLVETVRFQEKYKQLKLFYGHWTTTDQQSFMTNNHLCYVLDGPRERAYGAQFRPEEWPNIRLVWSGPTMRLFEDPSCP